MPAAKLDLSSADMAAIISALLLMAQRPPRGISADYLIALADRLAAFDAAMYPDESGDGRQPRPF